MVIQKIKELEALQARAAELQSVIEDQRTAELAALPANYGYDSLPAFIKALKAAVGKGGKATKAKKGAKKKAAKAEKPAKRTRAKITQETRDQVKALVEGGKTGAEIASELNISLPTVQNIKKALGLVKARAAS